MNKTEMPNRQATPEIPEYLRSFIAQQDPSLYTPIDHAAWRFIIKISKDYFSKAAHQKYLDGLEETGISTERIPLIEEMDAKLKRFGWRAVAVSGFIPPSIFMEFQSLGILPIACEMRTLEHLAYTPAPDIVHEAAGHAPILADPEFAEHLRAYGEVSRKAIFSRQDLELYEAIRTLSVVKEDPESTPEQLRERESNLAVKMSAITYTSEAQYLARMNWWSVEYGLVGDLKNPKIYGAGLLSSVGESYNCLGADVQKIPFTVNCIHTSYDITRPQPQLFVTPDFPHLTKVLEEYASTMAFRVGGIESLEKAKQAATVTTSVLDTGIQISGIVSEYISDETGKQPVYLRLSGPTQLAYEDQEIEGQGAGYHREGFSTVLGKLSVGYGSSSLARLSKDKLSGVVDFKFASGIQLQGYCKNIIQKNGLNILLSFENCTVKWGDRTLFRPEWGVFDLACGEKVTSVFGGASDRARYLEDTLGYQKPLLHPKTNATSKNLKLNQLYSKVRNLREQEERLTDLSLSQQLNDIYLELTAQYPEDWLLLIEILELVQQKGLETSWEKQVCMRLQSLSQRDTEIGKLIHRGLNCI